MPAEPEHAELDAEDALALRIGRVARAHVEVDNALRRVHTSLVSPSLAVYLTNRITATSTLVADCRSMLAKAGLAEQVESAAAATLDAASAANSTRNRVIHDMWLREDKPLAGAPQWKAYRRSKGLNLEAPDPPRDLRFLDAALFEMKRTEIRVNALNWRGGTHPQPLGHRLHLHPRATLGQRHTGPGSTPRVPPPVISSPLHRRQSHATFAHLPRDSLSPFNIRPLGCVKRQRRPEAETAAEGAGGQKATSASARSCR